MALQQPMRSAVGAGRVRVDGKFLSRHDSRFRIHGVTYGPFAPNARGDQFPSPERVCCDFARMEGLGVNSLRTYHVPPRWVLDSAAEFDLSVFVDVPWPKHICFLGDQEAQREARRAVRTAAELRHPAVFAYSIGNEIPADVVRWHGERKIEGFLKELADVAKQADPEALVTYANYPSTEYLDLSFLDFATFNVYLHDPEAFRRYLLRLHNQVGDRPLLLGEIGMDTFRHSEEEQAAFLGGHLAAATLAGVAGAYVFAWTDDWFTGGHQIEDWAFGVTRVDRSAKPACDALADRYRSAPFALLPTAPRVSVVICSYNGARTLDQCLRSMLAIDYPDYEVILVDDGSTDNTQEIARRYPDIRTIRQENLGLSEARNTGYRAASGSIIAYTDSDCFADPDWLTLLVHQLWITGANAVGGPNLTPDDGWLAACVAVCPGQPTHVLENDQKAEHVPGCNFAVYRETLEELGGFQSRYRKAGDDVDMCWRIMQAGYWITFSPGACVWHHRRHSPRAFLKQQAGYGEAEGLLWYDHPDKFNARGEGKWRGMMYGASSKGIVLSGPKIHRGPFGTGLFQTLYRSGPSHWAMLPSTLEWHVGVAAMALLALLWQPAWIAVAVMLLLSVLVAALQAATASLPTRYDVPGARLLIAGLCYAQPLVRSWWRYRARLFPSEPAAPYARPDSTSVMAGVAPLPPVNLAGEKDVDYWDENWRERTQLIEQITSGLVMSPWTTTIDSGWSDWDVEVHCHLWTVLQIRTVQEDHGSGRRLFRVRYRLKPTGATQLIAVSGVAAAVAATIFSSTGAALAATLLEGCALGAWLGGCRLVSNVAGFVDGVAGRMGLLRCTTSPSMSGRGVRSES
jgi:O-antigen biosynthesis protein